MDDEREQLKQANELLRDELDALKRLVQALRDNRNESEADKLLELENELLRAQLREQQAFLEGCQALMHNIPELGSSSAPTGLQQHDQLLKQGSENSLTLLHLLVSRCQSSSASWQSVQLPKHMFKSKAVPGFNITCNFQRDSTAMIYLRVDACFPNVSPDTVANGYWNTWVNAESFQKTLNSFHNTCTLPSHVPVPFVFKELMSTPLSSGANGVTKVNLYRELHEGEEGEKDWIYCMTRNKQDVALSMLTLPPELNPTVTTRRDQHTRRVVVNGGEFCPRKRNRGCPSASQLVGKRECIVLARSCMKGLEVADVKNPVCKHAIAADGLFVWQDEVSIDEEVECDGRVVEIQRKRIPATRACSFVSLVSDASPIQDLSIFSNAVDSMGRATERYAKLIDIFYDMMEHGD